MQNLRGSGSGMRQPAPSAEEDAGETPQWLSRIRQRSREEQMAQQATPIVPGTGEGEEDAPDWLRALKGEEPAAAGESEEETPDWLQSLGGGAPAETPPAPVESAAPAALEAAPLPAPAEENDDWMSALAATWGTSAEPAEEAAAEPAPTAEGEEYNWLQPGAPDEDLPPALPAEETPSWLSSLPSLQESGAEPQGELPVLGSDAPDWLRGMRAEQSEQAGEDDWLKDFQSAGSAAGSAAWLSELPPIQDSSAPEQQAEAPGDWLNAAPSGQAAGGETAGDYGWLKGIQAEEPPAEPAAEMPDWMRSAAPSGQAAGGETAGDYDWLKGIQAEEPPAEPAAETPDWMRSAAPSGQAAGGETAGDYDWLKGIQAEEPPAEAAAETPDWMRSAAPSEQAAGGAAAGDYDWLKGIQAEEPPAEAAADMPDWMRSAAPSGQAAGGAAAGDYDWLKNIQAEEPPAENEPAGWPGDLQAAPAGTEADWSVAIPAAAAPQGEALDWLGSLQDEAGQPAADEEVPGWIHAAPAEEHPTASFEQVPGWIKAAPVEEPAAAASDQVPAWVYAAPVVETISPAPAEETPAWLNGISGEETAPTQSPAWQGEVPAESAAPAVSAATPDWLSSLQPEHGGTAPLADEPDWLSTLQSEQAASPQPAAAETPDWLSLLPADQIETGAPAAGQEDWLSGLPEGGEPPLPAEETPAWLSGLPAMPGSQSAEAGEAPDWLKAYATESAVEGGTPAWTEQKAVEQAGPAAAAEPPDWLKPATAATPAPSGSDWLASFKVDDQEAVPGDGGALPFAGADLPDWLSNVAPPDEQPPEGAAPALIMDEDTGPSTVTISPFASEALPDWLSSSQPQQQAVLSASEAETPGGEGIEKGDVPTWLEAMRPVEAVAPVEGQPSEGDRRVEKAGPLSGMAGVLPGESVVVEYRKPPVYSVKLRVSERQKLHAELLEQILDSETQALQPRPRATRAPQRIVRLVIAVILILALVFPMAVGSQALPLPGLFPTETRDLYNQIETLSADSPVLLAVDYEPGLAGEMNLAAEPVIAHLMKRNARLVVISTVPAGQVLAEGLLARGAKTVQTYSLSERSINLGYLAGGPISLQEFARRPAEAAPYSLPQLLRYNLFNRIPPAWDSPVLNGVNGTVSGFARVVVITENADTGRAWIEQVKPALGDVPLLMVTSAQSAPLLQPYQGSGRLQGLLAGISGAAIYEVLNKQPGSARQYWDAYQLGLLVAIALILAGALLQGTAALLSRRKAKNEG